MLKSAKSLGDEFEAMISRATGWPIRNGRGFDFLPRPRVPVEARCRTQGTDGAAPRLTLTAVKVETSKAVIAGHFDDSGRLERALFVPMKDLLPSYVRYRQNGSRGQAHIPWAALEACPRARDITALLRAS